MLLLPLLWDGIPPPNNDHAIGSRRSDQKKKKKSYMALYGGNVHPPHSLKTWVTSSTIRWLISTTFFGSWINWNCRVKVLTPISMDFTPLSMLSRLRDHPQGSSGTLAMSTAGKRGANRRDERQQKQACSAGLQGTGGTWGVGQGRQDSNSRTGGGGMWERTPYQVDRKSKTGREGGESGTKIAVQLSIRVADGGGVRTQRVTVKIQ